MRSKECERGELLMPDMMRLRAVMLSVQNWTMGQRDGTDEKSRWTRMPTYWTIRIRSSKSLMIEERMFVRRWSAVGSCMQVTKRRRWQMDPIPLPQASPYESKCGSRLMSEAIGEDNHVGWS